MRLELVERRALVVLTHWKKHVARTRRGRRLLGESLKFVKVSFWYHLSLLGFQARRAYLKRVDACTVGVDHDAFVVVAVSWTHSYDAAKRGTSRLLGCTDLAAPRRTLLLALRTRAHFSRRLPADLLLVVLLVVLDNCLLLFREDDVAVWQLNVFLGHELLLRVGLHLARQFQNI